MNFLSIDFSMVNSSLFVKTKSKTFIKTLQIEKLNNDFLMQNILDFLKKNNIEFSDLSKIFVNQGPGNFSSLRASISIAKGISITQNLELLGYNSFVWLCAKFLNKKDFFYCLIEFKNKLFIKKFNKDLKSISKIKEVTENEILQKYDNKIIATSQNTIKHFSQKILKLDNLNVVSFDHKDLELLELKGLLNKDLIKPLYLS